MVRSLAIAAGGGGDAITASGIARVLEDVTVPAVMTYSWDRLMVDPTPGPRTAEDFAGLGEPWPGVHAIKAETRLRGAGRSSLPELAAALPVELLLLDPSHGAAGMCAQIRAAAEYHQADEVLVVDVGGDALANGHEPGLRSPIADFLALAAATLSGLPVRLIVAGLGLDGELAGDEMRARLKELDATHIATLTAEDVAGVRGLFEWHPSEANGLLAAAAAGLRGVVETRDGGGTVTLTDASADVYLVDGYKAANSSPASELLSTATLDEVEDVIRRLRGTTEIDYERQKAQRLAERPCCEPDVTVLGEIDRYVAAAAERGVDFLTVRRVAELVGATGGSATAELRRILRLDRLGQYQPPLYRTRPATPTR